MPMIWLAARVKAERKICVLMVSAGSWITAPDYDVCIAFRWQGTDAAAHDGAINPAH